tara:strand:+ start:545 stop:727 length:183 start_codon:yes stop_codon:yes gene_type:complete
MDKLKYISDYRSEKDRSYMVWKLRKNVELLSVNAEILVETGSDADIDKLSLLLQGLNNRY